MPPFRKRSPGNWLTCYTAARLSLFCSFAIFHRYLLLSSSFILFSFLSTFVEITHMGWSSRQRPEQPNLLRRSRTAFAALTLLCVLRPIGHTHKEIKANRWYCCGILMGPRYFELLLFISYISIKVLAKVRANGAAYLASFLTMM